MLSILDTKKKKITAIICAAVIVMLIGVGAIAAVMISNGGGAEESETPTTTDKVEDMTVPAEDVAYKESYDVISLSIPRPDGWNESEYNSLGTLEVRIYEAVADEESAGRTGDADRVETTVADVEHTGGFADDDSVGNLGEPLSYKIVGTIEGVKMDGTYPISVPYANVVASNRVEVAMTVPMNVKDAANPEGEGVPIGINPVQFVITDGVVSNMEANNAVPIEMTANLVFLLNNDVNQESETDEGNVEMINENGDIADSANGGIAQPGAGVQQQAQNGNQQSRPQHQNNAVTNNGNPTNKPSGGAQSSKQWTCLECGKVFTVFDEYCQHNHPKKKAWVCRKCNFVANSDNWELFERHLTAIYDYCEANHNSSNSDCDGWCGSNHNWGLDTIDETIPETDWNDFINHVAEYN